MSGGVATKIIAVGIGSNVSLPELESIASLPRDKNVIRATDYNSLSAVEDQLLNEICIGK